MEKQRINTAAKSCRRLLISILLFVAAVPLGAQVLTASIIKELTLTPAVDQNLYAKEDIKFEVYIPYAKSSQIQVQSPSLAADVTFKQIKKYDDFSDGSNGGVKLEIWYRFGKKGNYQLPALSLIIQNRKRTIKFAPVTIHDNPADMNPRIVIEFSNGQTIYSDTKADVLKMPVGEPLSFTVNLQYAVQLIQFTYDIPKESIFTQTNVFEIVEIKYREKNYSDDLIPVATFDWTGLMPGPHSLPPFKMQVTGYNGYRIDCVTPEIIVDFIADVSGTASSSNVNSAFDDAFDFDFAAERAAKQAVITEDFCQELAELRIKERNAIFGHNSNRHERRELEEKFEISAAEDEFYMGIYYLSYILLLAALVFFIYLLRKKNRNKAIIVAGLFICAIAFCVYTQVKKNESYAIFKGGKVSSIPEENAESYSEISAGNRVRITEKAGKWYYIELGETGGWCNADKVIVIK